jgi:hypothetical protein
VRISRVGRDRRARRPYSIFNRPVFKTAGHSERSEESRDFDRRILWEIHIH